MQSVPIGLFIIENVPNDHFCWQVMQILGRKRSVEDISALINLRPDCESLTGGHELNFIFPAGISGAPYLRNICRGKTNKSIFGYQFASSPLTVILLPPCAKLLSKTRKCWKIEFVTAGRKMKEISKCEPLYKLFCISILYASNFHNFWQCLNVSLITFFFFFWIII